MRLARLLLVVGCALLAACAPHDNPAAPPPNILFILLDDFGVNDLDLHSGRVGLTPNLDSFAREGVRFSRNYVDSTCSATRAGILTGRPPASLAYRPAGPGISPEVTTLPEALQAAGYTTHHVGKWHLGYMSRLAWPTAQGFDTFFGYLDQFMLRYPFRGGKPELGKPSYNNPWLHQGAGPSVEYKGHLSEILLRQVLAFLDGAAQRERPWFLNYWMALPHTPLQPAPGFAAMFPATPQGRYRAMLAQLDYNVGQVLAALQRNGLDRDTLVIIASDNGGTANAAPSNLPLAGGKGNFAEGGVRTPLLVRWPDGRWGGRVVDDVVSYLDYLPTLVTAAGGTVPAGLAGRDIAPLLEGRSLRPQTLFWESGDRGATAWAALSADGRWRLIGFSGRPPALHDLAADPGETTDVAQRHPEVTRALAQEFLAWRDQQRRIALHYREVDESGRGELVGESLQRTPATGTRSFVVGVRPGAGAQAGPREVIATQAGYWELWLQDGLLNVAMDGLRLQAPAPEPGRCSAIAVVSRYAWQRLSHAVTDGALELYVDGSLVASAQSEDVPFPPDDYLAPTFLGRDAAGAAQFSGALGPPLLFNERLVEDASADPQLGNGLGPAGREACAGLAGG